jgi:hypothetical protein
MSTLGSDIRFVVRSLAKSKLFTAVALLSLALGIGANVTVFSLVNAIAFKPLPYAEPDALVDVHEWSATKLCTGCVVGTSFPTFMDWRANARSFAAFGASQGGRLVIAGIALGLGGSFLVLRVIQSLLFGASPIDVPIFAGVAALLAAIAFVAVWIPARRATRVDPMEALRAE